MEEGILYTPSSPTETPFRTPSSSWSRVSRPFDDRSPASTPPPLPTERPAKRRSHESLERPQEDGIPLRDPRRFTPTLHASLVSEILNLRKELENSTKSVERLEATLHTVQSQNEVLRSDLQASNKEARQYKRQVQQLDSQTSTALDELSEERDTALASVVDLQRRLDQSQKRARSQEEHTEKTQELREKEQNEWAIEKRNLENKVYVVEGRLKLVVEELEQLQHEQKASQTRDLPPAQPTTDFGSPGKVSVLSHTSRRLSNGSLHSDDGSIHTGANLADEIHFEDEVIETYYQEDDDDGRSSPDALPEEKVRPQSSLSLKAKKILGLGISSQEADQLGHGGYEKSPFLLTPTTLSPTVAVKLQPQYVDSGIQWSPPPSPQVLPTESKAIPARMSLDMTRHIGHKQRSSIYSERGLHELDETASCRTLPSPPLTPERLEPDYPIPVAEPDAVSQMRSTSTQTETTQDYLATAVESEVPTIAIIPPASRPATPETRVVLPPRTKNAGSQVNLGDLESYTSRGVQTEEIRVDMRNIVAPSQARPLLLSKHFRPPASSRDLGRVAMVNAASTTSSRLSMRRSSATGLSTTSTKDRSTFSRDMHRPSDLSLRSNSPFEDLDSPITEVHDKGEGVDLAEDDLFDRPTTKYTLRAGKLVAQDSDNGEEEEDLATLAGQAAALEQLRMSEDELAAEIRANSRTGRNSPPRRYPHAQMSKQLKRVNSIRSANMRKAAEQSSSNVMNQLSLAQTGGAGVKPPFPVPLRYSSARIGKSVSEGGRSSPGSSRASPTRKGKARKHVLRKAKSGPAISPHGQARRRRSPSPPFDSQVSIVPDMPSFQMPTTNNYPFLSEPYTPPPQQTLMRTGPPPIPPRQVAHVKTDSNSGSVQQTSVIDSITQTMIGEWMYKYKRRRKSFGVTDKSNDWDPHKNIDELSSNPNATGVRHKRWVWLAPYEKSVMWSSKQPTSNAALMGKHGRKLTINSVLDVKDDNPMPKNSLAGPHFNRSIIILTPERALKFTAISQERHYVWLTALSFLSHSPLSVDDLITLHPQEEERINNPGPVLPAGSLRRRPLRDSIRIAKDTRRGGMVFTNTDPLPDPSTRSNSRLTQRQSGFDPLIDPAAAPTVRRFATRERSNTGPTVPQNSLRGLMNKAPFTSLTRPSSSNPQYVRPPTAVSSDRGTTTPIRPTFSTGHSRQVSDGSTSAPLKIPYPSHPEPNFNSTMRMQAFIENNSINAKAISRDHRGERMKRDRYYRGGSERERSSISPVDSLLHAEIRAATSSSTRESVESRDPFRIY